MAHILLLLVVILAVNCVFAQHIARQKCAEYVARAKAHQNAPQCKPLSGQYNVTQNVRDFPANVLIEFSPGDNNSLFVCDGVVISDDTVLTSADCMIAGGITTALGILIMSLLSNKKPTVRMMNVRGYVNPIITAARSKDTLKMLMDNRKLLRFGAGESVLDVGCGPGNVTAQVLAPWLPSDYRQLLGVDISVPMINHALNTFAGDKVSFSTCDISGDVSSILLNDKYSCGFHKIFSFYTLHWIHDLEKCLKNLFFLMRPGGQVLLRFPIDHTFQKAYIAVCAQEKWKNFFIDVRRRITPFPSSEDPGSEFQEMLSSVGFKMLRCEVQDICTVYDSVQGFKELIQSLDLHLDRLPPDLLAPYLTDCLHKMRQLGVVTVKDPQVFVKQSLLLAVANKPI